MGGNYAIRVDWTTVDNVAGNSSQVKATMYLVQAGSWSLDVAAKDCSIWVNGTEYKFQAPAISNSGGKTTKLGAITTNAIAHNADGSKQVQIAANYYLRATISGTYYTSISTGEKTITLTTLPRATTPTLSASSIDMGATLTITLPRASASFTHDLAYSFAGGSYVTFATGAGASYAWTVADLASKIPNATSGTMTIRCITKSGSTQVGTKTVVLTVKVPASVVPTVSAVSLTEAVSGLAAQFGAFIQSKSKIKAAITATGAKGSTIKSITTTFAGYSYTGASFTTYTVSGSGTLAMVTTITDSRGRTVKKTTNVTVLAYTRPSILAFNAERCDSDGTPNDSGTYARISYKYSVAALGNKNTVTAQIQSKTTTETAWTTKRTLSGYTGDSSVVLGTFSLEQQYDLRLVVSDYFVAANPYTVMLPTDDVILDIYKDGTGLAIRKVAELADLFDVNVDTRLRKALQVDGILDALKGIRIQDTRDVSLSPAEYIAMGRSVITEFKQCSTLSFTATTRTYCTLVTYTQWQNTSGGLPKQLLLDDGGIWYRVATSAEAWGAWKAVHYRTIWTALGNGVSYKIHDGLCTVRGNSDTIKSIGKAGVDLGTLPAEARPTVDITGALTTKANASGQYSILTTGVVRAWNLAGDSTYWAFCVTYPVE